jgi:coronin-7
LSSARDFSVSSLDIFDFEVHPFSGDVLAGGEDGNVTSTTTSSSSSSSSTTVLGAHGKRVTAVGWHRLAPLAASGSLDGSARIWDVTAGREAWAHGGVEGGITALSWSFTGALLATAGKDRRVRVHDPRASSVVAEWEAHEGVQGSKVTFLGSDHHVVTTGFSKQRTRQQAVWDTRSTAKALVMRNGESSTAPVIPYYDRDSELLLFAGRADTSIRLNVATDSSPFLAEVSTFMSPAAHKEIALLPKTCLEVMSCEVARIYRLTQTSIEVVSLQVPRKVKREYEDVAELYPDTCSWEPTTTAQEWFAGTQTLPKTVNLRPKAKRDAGAPATTTAAPAAATSTSTTAASAAPNPAVEQHKTVLPSSLRGSTVGRDSVSMPLGRDSVSSASGSAGPGRSTPVINLVRASKFRNNFPTLFKPELHYYELKPDLQSFHESNSIDCNESYFALPWSGNGGHISIVKHEHVGRWLPARSRTWETGLGHVTDLAFNPFSATSLALGGENGTVLHVDFGADCAGEPRVSKFVGHTARVTRVLFHPTVSSVLATTGGDPEVRLWDLEAGRERQVLAHPGEFVFDGAWSYDGTLLATTAKDRQIRLWDVRAGKAVRETEGHEGGKTSRIVWLGNTERFATTGFSKGSDRQICVYDARAMGKPLSTTNIDVNPGTLMPFYDEDIGVLYVSGKGSGWIKCYEIVPEAPYIHYLTEQASPTPNSGVCAFPKKVVDVRKVEVGKFLRLSKDRVEPVLWSTPRTRKEFFQDDVYPDTRDGSPVASASEFFGSDSSRTFAPRLTSLRPAGMDRLSDAPPLPEKVHALQKFAKDMEADRSNERTDKLMAQFASEVQRNGGTMEEKKVVVANADNCVADDEWD